MNGGEHRAVNFLWILFRRRRVGVSSGYSTAWWATTRPAVLKATALVLVVRYRRR